VVEGVSFSSCDKDIFMTVVVVIANSHAKAIAYMLARKPGLLRDILKSPISEIAIKRIVEKRR